VVEVVKLEAETLRALAPQLLQSGTDSVRIIGGAGASRRGRTSQNSPRGMLRHLGKLWLTQLPVGR
jgi:hypothetical protein